MLTSAITAVITGVLTFFGIPPGPYIAGVWIGDASAFPTASGANPMWSIMALARRTAQAIAVKRSR